MQLLKSLSSKLADVERSRQQITADLAAAKDLIERHEALVFSFKHIEKSFAEWQSHFRKRCSPDNDSYARLSCVSTLLVDGLQDIVVRLYAAEHAEEISAKVRAIMFTGTEGALRAFEAENREQLTALDRPLLPLLPEATAAPKGGVAADGLPGAPGLVASQQAPPSDDADAECAAHERTLKEELSGSSPNLSRG
jgi:hypothetical protein